MFGKKTKIFLAVFMIHIFGFTMAGNVFGAQYDNITDLGLTSKSALLMEANTGTVIYEQNSHEKLPPASVTKVMTMLLVYEAEAAGKFKWEDMVTVSEHAASMGGSQVFLEPMEQQTAHDLTKCIAIASANDGAVAMAEFVAGSEEAFVELMNKRAQELGMLDTHFVNACGLDAEGHLTSASDIATMTRELVTKHPEVFEFTKTWQDTITHKTKRGETEFGLTNTNKLLKWYQGATGLKTGSTGKALYCLSGTAEKDGMGLIGVVMAAPDFKTRFREVMKQFDYGFANYAVEKGLPKGKKVGQIAVCKGMEDTVDVVVQNEVTMLSRKGEGQKTETELKLIPTLKAPFEAETKVGEMIYKAGGTEVARTDVVTADGMEKANVESILRRLLTKWCK